MFSLTDVRWWLKGPTGFGKTLWENCRLGELNPWCQSFGSARLLNTGRILTVAPEGTYTTKLGTTKKYLGLLCTPLQTSCKLCLPVAGSLLPPFRLVKSWTLHVQGESKLQSCLKFLRKPRLQARAPSHPSEDFRKLAGSLSEAPHTYPTAPWVTPWTTLIFSKNISL